MRRASRCTGRRRSAASTEVRGDDPGARERPAVEERAGSSEGRKHPSALQASITLGPSAGLPERLRCHLAEEREVAVEFGVRALYEDDFGRDGIARRQAEGVRELDKAGVTEKDAPVRRLDLLRKPLEVREGRDQPREPGVRLLATPTLGLSRKDMS